MKKCFPFLILITVLWVTPSLIEASQDFQKRESQWIEIENYQLHFEMPKDWEYFKDFISIPLMVKSPQRSQGRVVISVTPFHIDNIEFEHDEIEKNQEIYKQGRENWLSEIYGESLEYFPYRVQKWKNAKEVQSIGFSFLLNQTIYSEHSFYVNCKDHIFHIKALYRHDDFFEDREDIINIVKSFDCKPPTSNRESI